MNYLQQVQKGIEYIEANLDFDVSAADVAKQAGMSQWHFQRVFKGLTNETLKFYIRSRRFADALKKLQSTDMRILDIAMHAGFASQESFSRAFKLAFDLTPKQYRQSAAKHLVMKKMDFNREYLEHIHQNISLEPIIYQQPKMYLVGCRTHFYSVDSEKNNIASKLPALWAEFLARLAEVGNKVGGNCFGIVQQTAENSDLLEYVAAIEVSTLKDIPNGMFSLIIEESTYAKFAHTGAVSHLDNTVNYIYSSWLLNACTKHSYGPDIEIYGEEYQPNSNDSVIYYSIPLID